MTGGKAFYEDICLGNEVLEYAPAGGVGRVKGEAAFAAVEVEEEAAGLRCGE